MEAIGLYDDRLARLAVSSSPSALLAVVEHRTGPSKMDHTPDIRNINSYPKRIRGYKDFARPVTESFKDSRAIGLVGKEGLAAKEVGHSTRMRNSAIVHDRTAREAKPCSLTDKPSHAVHLDPLRHTLEATLERRPPYPVGHIMPARTIPI